MGIFVVRNWWLQYAWIIYEGSGFNFYFNFWILLILFNYFLSCLGKVSKHPKVGVQIYWGEQIILTKSGEWWNELHSYRGQGDISLLGWRGGRVDLFLLYCKWGYTVLKKKLWCVAFLGLTKLLGWSCLLKLFDNKDIFLKNSGQLNWAKLCGTVN